ncbi:hypothetical protein P3X46_003183 [Hevea brasiliensis]|uniref:Fe2OG dioxygenase domain-containing protein n=1 Tax=Hevea brasiliensis TaxID=3981 RepID=A0ABQ9N5G5_HEVBR|nr:uncharacterized protein LOC110660935 isoform X2 [Hevea brasiliensis]KAJ9187762.1 hypothetical protein P3X46_003183 [Hevea brasiliensis]
MDDQKTLLKQVFGESSDSEDDDEQQQRIEDSVSGDGSHLTIDHNPIWEPIKEINGLWLCRDFLSPQQQSSLLSDIQNEGWFTVASNNQAMRFGDLPSWAIELSNSIREVVLFGDQICKSADSVSCEGDKGTCIIPTNLLWREPLFDQLIVNVYQPGEGICAHVDLMRFEDGIAIVSLESSCVMHFTQVGEDCENGKGENDQPMPRVPVHLTRGSVVLLWGDARYLWKHEINRKPGFQMWEGKELNQKRRTSITLRKLCCVE